MSKPASEPLVVGVDGCPGGWVAVTVQRDSFTATVYPTFAGLLYAVSHAAVIAVDIPIGLSTTGPR